MTQTAKHTPGPWHVAARNGDVTKVLTYPGLLVAEVRGATGPKAEMAANARLIAAAPETASERDRLKELNAELLAVLKRCLAEIERGGSSLTTLEAMKEDAHAAIATAERREHD